MARRTTSAPSRAPLWLGLSLAAGVVVLAAPFAVVEFARGDLDRDACRAGGPGLEFYSSHVLLDRVSVLPWVAARAQAVSSEAALACLEAMTADCGRVRDEALDHARQAQAAQLGVEGSGPAAAGSTDWQVWVDAGERAEVCERWGGYRDWLTGHGLAATGACAVCDTP